MQGVLAGFDQKSNVVLSDSKERVYSMDEGVEEIPLGLYLVKGDMMSVSFYSLFSPLFDIYCSMQRAHRRARRRPRPVRRSGNDTRGSVTSHPILNNQPLDRCEWGLHATKT